MKKIQAFKKELAGYSSLSKLFKNDTIHVQYFVRLDSNASR